jgi:hypothetical protein
MSNSHEFFKQFPIHAVTSNALSEVLAASQAAELTILFLWGRDCPNCEIAKGALLIGKDRLDWPDVRWLHCNVYEDADMAIRFSLHGIPVFLLFRASRSLGRITSWPGMQSFIAAVERQRKQVSF